MESNKLTELQQVLNGTQFLVQHQEYRLELNALLNNMLRRQRSRSKVIRDYLFKVANEKTSDSSELVQKRHRLGELADFLVERTKKAWLVKGDEASFPQKQINDFIAAFKGSIQMDLQGDKELQILLEVLVTPKAGGQRKLGICCISWMAWMAAAGSSKAWGMLGDIYMARYVRAVSPATFDDLLNNKLKLDSGNVAVRAASVAFRVARYVEHYKFSANKSVAEVYWQSAMDAVPNLASIYRSEQAQSTAMQRLMGEVQHRREVFFTLLRDMDRNVVSTTSLSNCVVAYLCCRVGHENATEWKISSMLERQVLKQTPEWRLITKWNQSPESIKTPLKTLVDQVVRAPLNDQNDLDEVEKEVVKQLDVLSTQFSDQGKEGYDALRSSVNEVVASWKHADRPMSFLTVYSRLLHNRLQRITEMPKSNENVRVAILMFNHALGYLYQTLSLNLELAVNDSFYESSENKYRNLMLNLVQACLVAGPDERLQNFISQYPQSSLPQYSRSSTDPQPDPLIAQYNTPAASVWRMLLASAAYARQVQLYGQRERKRVVSGSTDMLSSMIPKASIDLPLEDVEFEQLVIPRVSTMAAMWSLRDFIHYSASPQGQNAATINHCTGISGRNWLRVLIFKQYSLTIGIMLLVMFSKAIPHVPNFSPEIVFALYISANHSRVSSLLLIALLAVCSDVIFAIVSGYPAFGNWTWFTYSGLLFVLVFKVKSDQLQFVKCGVSLTLCYWLWD